LKNNISDSFPVTKSLRQGCYLSPTLLKIYLNEALRRWRRSSSGIQISDDRTLYTLHFADDQVVIAQDKEDLEEECMTRKLLNEYEEWGLSVNRAKTKYLCIGDDRADLHPQENETRSCCTEYLGTKIDNRDRTEKEI